MYVYLMETGTPPPHRPADTKLKLQVFQLQKTVSGSTEIHRIQTTVPIFTEQTRTAEMWREAERKPEIELAQDSYEILHFKIIAQPLQCVQNVHSIYTGEL